MMRPCRWSAPAWRCSAAHPERFIVCRVVAEWPHDRTVNDHPMNSSDSSERKPSSEPDAINHSSQRAEIWAGVKQGLVVGVVIVALGAAALPWLKPRLWPAATTTGNFILPHAQRNADFAGEQASSDARQIANWAVKSGDHGQLAFVIIDKKNTRVFVFDSSGRLTGATPVLIGAAVGDDSVAGIGNRPIEEVMPSERTTPAGRFVAEPGRNTLGEDVVWVDYDAAVSMHRVRTLEPRERRLERLASPTTEDNRISYGCINVPVDFFEAVIKPVFNARRAVVYVLPEVKSVNEVFPFSQSVAARQSLGAPG